MFAQRRLVPPALHSVSWGDENRITPRWVVEIDRNPCIGTHIQSLDELLVVLGATSLPQSAQQIDPGLVLGSANLFFKLNDSSELLIQSTTVPPPQVVALGVVGPKQGCPANGGGDW
jgi:hypothetical protein